MGTFDLSELQIEGDPSPLTASSVTTLVRATLAACALPSGAIDGAVHFVSADRMQALNHAHRDRDAVTDVLSFPIDGIEDLPAGIPRQLGDVMICTEHVRGQLAAGETMLPRDGRTGDATLFAALARCVVHGVLHLLGEDHEVDDAAAQRMFELEERVLASDIS